MSADGDIPPNNRIARTEGAVSISSATARPRRRIAAGVDRLIGFVTGDDVFVSYSRADATSYAAALADALTERMFSCYLDQWTTTAGGTLPTALRTAVRRSGIFVLLASPAALQSKPIADEIAEFLPTERPLVVIRLSTSRDDTGLPDQLRGAAVTLDIPDALSPRPSKDVVDRIVNSLKTRTRNQRLRRSFWAVVAGTATVLAAGFLIGSQIVSGLRTDIGKLSGDLKTLSKDRDVLAANVSGLTTDRDRLVGQNQQLETQRKNLENQATAAQAEAEASAARASSEQARADEASRLAEINATEAERQARVAKVRRLASAISSPAVGDPALQLVLAYEAWKAGSGLSISEVNDGLFLALSAQGGRKLPVVDPCGRADTFRRSQLVLDGQWLLVEREAGSPFEPRGGSICLWDLRDLGAPPSPTAVSLEGDERVVGITEGPRNLVVTFSQRQLVFRVRDIGALRVGRPVPMSSIDARGLMDPQSGSLGRMTVGSCLSTGGKGLNA